VQPVNKTNTDYFTSRCYCFLSRFPFFKIHFEVIYSLLGKENGKNKKNTNKENICFSVQLKDFNFQQEKDCE
jgi:hypothetical protein